jgi:hypothetical protein
MRLLHLYLGRTSRTWKVTASNKDAIMLGASIRSNSNFYNYFTSNMPSTVLIYDNEGLSEFDKCRLGAVGWSLRFIPPVETSESSSSDSGLFLNIEMWKMTEYESIVYLSTKSLVTGNMNATFDIVVPYEGQPSIAEFAAVGELTPEGFAITFGPGMYVLRPSQAIFERLIVIYKGFNDSHALLNSFFAHDRLILPYTFSLSMESSTSAQHNNLEILLAKAQTVAYSECHPQLGQCAKNAKIAKLWDAAARVSASKACIL